MVEAVAVRHLAIKHSLGYIEKDTGIYFGLSYPEKRGVRIKRNRKSKNADV